MNLPGHRTPLTPRFFVRQESSFTTTTTTSDLISAHRLFRFSLASAEESAKTRYLSPSPPSLFFFFLSVKCFCIFVSRGNVLSARATELPWQQNGACYEFTQANEYKRVLDRERGREEGREGGEKKRVALCEKRSVNNRTCITCARFLVCILDRKSVV